jgi:hypothetical protein
MSDAEKLEPCQDCDSRELTMVEFAMGSSTRYRVACTLCGSHGPQSKTEAQARRLWNTRKQKEPTK